MGLRPAKAYRRPVGPAYTRISTTKPRLSYIKGVPGTKIVMYDMGNKTGYFDTEVSLISLERMQLRHNSLEAARITVNKYLSKNVGNVDFRFKIRIYPHHVMRENPLATGAGADRFSTGMKKAFGKPIGKAARVKENQKLMTVWVNSDNIEAAKEALRKAKMKLSCKTAIIVSESELPKPEGR